MKRIAVLLVAALLATGLSAGNAAEHRPPPPKDKTSSTIVAHQFSVAATGQRLAPSKTAGRRAPVTPPARTLTARPAPGTPGSVPMAPAGSTRSDPGAGAAPAVAIGPIPYTRSSVATSYTEFPTSTNGKISVRFTAGSRTCSGTVVHSGTDNHRSVVFTAARCVYRESLGGWAQDVTFIPAYSNGSAPFGEWPARDAFLPAEWIDEDENPRFDVAALHIPPNPSGETLEKDKTGGMGLRWNQSFENQPTEAFAYPASPFTGQRLYKCLSETRNDFPQPPGEGEPNLAIGCDLPPEGTAGGGWIVHELFTGDSYLTSVFSHKPRNETEVSFGPYFGTMVGELYRAAANPVTHEMSVTFRLKGHLRAVGRITARDGYVPCRVNAPIRIQRKTAKQWRTVRRILSRPTGRYRVRVPDRPGLYRAFSPAGFVDDDNRCSSAKSRTRRH